MMNYGLTQMSKANYPEAEKYFLKTVKLLPQYPYIYVNLGILYSYEKKNDEAEEYFKQAIAIGSNIPSICYFYAKHLHNTGRNDKALEILKQVLSISPADIDSRYCMMQIYQEQGDWPNLIATANETLAMLPGDKTATDYLASAAGKKGKLEEALDNVKQNPTPNNYIGLSLVYYNQKDYQKCIDACNEALKIDSKNKLAYNNIGSAYNVMGEWALAEKAFKQALAIDPNFQLAKNNLVFAVSQLSKTDSLIAIVKKAPTPENYINLSLYYYRQGQYQKSIDACKEIIKTNPSYVLAYNNMCAAYNVLQQWDNAIAAGEKAVALDPANQLAKNNLAAAKQGKAKSGK
jgi:tetratricopeptide (TPR) repeat protein